MKDLQLHLEGDRFRAGETIIASVHWSLERPPAACLLNLLWYTSGVGEEAVGIVERHCFDHLESQGRRRCRFTAPKHPPSFSGRLVSLQWAVEALLQPVGGVARCDVIIAPERQAVDLHRRF